jgi:hypothetical protein
MGAVNGTIGISGGSSGQQALPVLLSQHHGLVSALNAAHAAYGPTVRLAKRWLGAHLLLGGQVRLAALTSINMNHNRSCLSYFWGNCYKWILSPLNGTLHSIVSRCKHLPRRYIQIPYIWCLCADAG